MREGGDPLFARILPLSRLRESADPFLCVESSSSVDHRNRLSLFRMGSAPAQIPTSFGHELRACLRCRLVKTYDQVNTLGFKDGLPDCDRVFLLPVQWLTYICASFLFLLTIITQFRESGCENCPFFKMDEDHERVVDCTTPNFTGYASFFAIILLLLLLLFLKNAKGFAQVIPRQPHLPYFTWINSKFLKTGKHVLLQLSAKVVIFNFICAHFS